MFCEADIAYTKKEQAPAVHHYGSSILWVARFNLFKELKHANRGKGHSKIWPAGEMELSHQPLGLLPGHIPHLQTQNKENKFEINSVYAK